MIFTEKLVNTVIDKQVTDRYDIISVFKFLSLSDLPCKNITVF